VPMATFRLLYAFVILHRRRAVHFNVTATATAAWTAAADRRGVPR
jgi:hypothetical protein